MVSIDKLDFQDLELLRPLVDEYITAQSRLDFRPDCFEKFCDYINEMRGNKEKIGYIAKDGEKNVGLIIGSIDSNSRLLYPDKIGYVPFLSVLPEYRNKSVGFKLWQELKKWYEENSIDEVELYTMVDNEIAKGFWTKCSFEPHLERRRLILKR